MMSTAYKSTVPYKNKQYGYHYKAVRSVYDKETGQYNFYVGSKKISPWHHITMHPDSKVPTVVTMVVEIPRMSTKKNEISTTIPFNPIIHDQHNGKFRYAKPKAYHYGAIPQTWEYAGEVKLGNRILHGDNDPFDIIDVSHLTASVGDVIAAKVVAAIPAVDSGELDWKYVAVNINDALVSKVNTLADVERYFPAEFAAIRAKYFGGGSTDGAVSAKEAVKQLRGAHAAWALLAEDCGGTVSASQSTKRAHDTAKERLRMAIDPYVEC